MKVSAGLKLGISFFFNSFRAPYAIGLEISNDCQASCTMCKREKLHHEKMHMSMDIFEKVISQAKKINIKVFQLSFYGDPLLDPEFSKKLSFLRKNIPDATIVFNTNGQNLTDKLIGDILKFKVNIIRFSIEGNNKKEYEQIRQGLNYDVLIKNIHNLKKKKDVEKSDLQIIVWGLSLEDFPLNKIDYSKFWKQYADKVEIRYENKIILNSKENFLQKLLPCHKPFSDLLILADGSVTTCAKDWYREHVFGSVTKETISSLWFSKRMFVIRLVNLIGAKRLINPCSNCSYRVFNTHLQNKVFQN